MSVALYIDENVHRGITDGLRIRGVDVLTVQEDGRTSFPDPLILDRVLFSQDDDFLAEANHRQDKQINFAGVIYAHKLRVTVGDCVRDLEIIAKTAYLEELSNRIQYLPL
ncbi:DUF5615 family PIN-like protein [Nostoc sp.]|uniref:DUF5615 family PIN-like protein n=1 Tax=Nostoc sp. TaxID=1180 RepID=UPI002FFA2751